MNNNFEKMSNTPDSFLTEIKEEQAFGAAEHTRMNPLGDNNTGTGPEGEEGKMGGEDSEKKKGRIPLEGLINGRLILDMADGLLAAIVIWILAIVFRRTAKHNDMRLTETEKEVLDPVVDACLEYIDIEINNPFVLLGLCMGLIYSGKAWNKSEPLPKKSKKPDTGKPTKDGVVEEATVEDKKEKPREQPTFEDRTQRPPSGPLQTIYYSYDELKQLAKTKQVSIPTMKQRLANKHSKQGIKCVFLARDEEKPA